MRLDTTGRGEATLTSTTLVTPLRPARPLVVPGSLRRAAAIGGELLALVGIVFCIPFVILAIGMPIALGVRLLLWVGGML